MSAPRVVYNFTSMRFSGTLQKNVPVDDGSGGQVDAWTTVVTTRCSLEKLSGRLVDNAMKLEYNKYYIVQCRFQSGIVLDTDSRWIINGEIYKVTDFERVDFKPHYYTFNVTK